ncbi:hypothetical protein QQ045_030997 [Rhodiola kirilowii]
MIKTKNCLHVLLKILMKKLQEIILAALLLLQHFSTAASTEIPLGSILYASKPASSSWSSPNTKFSLRFIPSSSSSTSFVASINHGALSVWQAGGISKAVVDSNGHFCLHSSGDLRLVNSSKVTIWSSGTSGLNVTSAFLTDSGNLVLNNRSVSVWSSFDHPTDTLVPLQNLTVENFLQSGIYSLNFDKSGDMVLKWNHSVEYWQFGSSSTRNVVNYISPSLSILAVGVLTISDETLSDPLKVIFSDDYGEGSDDDDEDTFRFLKMDSDGNLRIYSSSKIGIITQQWAALSDQCLVFGFCGDMGICSYNDSGDPVCRCASQNFVPVDLNDSRKGCKRKLEIDNCSETIEMVQLDHTKFLTFGRGLASDIFFKAGSACRLNCLTDTVYVASSSLSDGSGKCHLKKPGFLSGYHSPAFLATSYIKVCGAVASNPTSASSENILKHNGKRVSVLIVAVAVLCAVLGLLLLECAVWCCCKKFSKFGASNTHDALLEYASSSPVQFSYKELQIVTKGFTEKLGEGGFGTVFRGTFANKYVAVKQMDGIEQGEKHFRTVVSMISSTHHLNLVKLVGFCSEGRHRLIVYEFMKNGSLANFLFDLEESSGKVLNWDVRFRISIGAARGLSYLHESCRDCIVHCNFKPENILLDENNNAKVSDFGLASLTNPNGIINGYLAPERLANLPVTSKSDVYSFGMVLLEIVSGRRNFEEVGSEKFCDWAYNEYEKGNGEGILDKRLVGVQMEKVKRVIEVSFWCIQEQPSCRPTMGKVVQMLEGVVEIEKPPAPKNEGSSRQVVRTLSVTFLSAKAPSPSSSFTFPVVQTT